MLVTFDGAEVLAYDARTEAPTWRVACRRPIAGVVLADATGLDLGDAGAPFRTPAAVGAVLTVDDEGRIHVIDGASGRLLGEMAPLGPPRAIAASPNGGGIALAAGDAVHVFRKAARVEIAMKASALAFSNDGATLAVGTKDGTVKTFDVSRVEHDETPSETSSVSGKEAIVGLAQHPAGAWLVGVASGIVHLDPSAGPRRLDKIRSGPKRLAVDAGGDRIAMQLTERQVLVYEWPTFSVIARIEYGDRPVRGLAFGDGDWLGVALDHGDGNKIDVVTCAVHRTEPHPGRTRRSWTLHVQGKSDRLSTKEAEEIRRARSPSTPASPGFGGGRLGIGAAIGLAVLGLRVCARTSMSSRSSTHYPPVPAATARCDRACATERIRSLKTECAKATNPCEEHARRALAAIEAGDCPTATAALERIGKSDVSGSPFLGLGRILAELGLREACADGTIQPKKVAHARLVRLAGPDLEPTIEDIPELRPDDGETPHAVWASPDGAVFVAALTGGSPTAVIHQRSPAGTWRLGFHAPLAEDDAALGLFGRSASDVYATAGGKLVHFDGKRWDDVPVPGGTVESVSGTTRDLLVAVSDGDAEAEVYRRNGDEWTKEKMPAGLDVVQLQGGGPSAWAIGRMRGRSVVASRAADGTWTARTPKGDGGSASLTGLWVSPSGDPFVLGDTSVLRGAGGGARWAEDDLGAGGVIQAAWGRSRSDVYAVTTTRLVHFDGKAWAPTSYSGGAVAVSGTAKEVLVVRADE